MLYWICPECGHECSPAIRECPTCAAPPEAERKGVSTAMDNAELLSLAQNFQSSSAVAVLAPPVAVAVQDPPEAMEAARPQPRSREPELWPNLAPLDGLKVNPARPRRSDPAPPVPTPLPVRIASPAVASAEAPAGAELGFKAAGPAPAREVTFRAARGGNAQPFDRAIEPLPSRRQSVAFVRAELPV